MPGAGGAGTAGAVRRADGRRGAGAARRGAALPRPDLGAGGDRGRHGAVVAGGAGGVGARLRHRIRAERVGRLRRLYPAAAAAAHAGGGRFVRGRTGGGFRGVPDAGVRQPGVPRRPGGGEALGRADRDPADAPAAPGGADARLMRLADFDFDLPPDRIAQHPARPRDAARLLHVARDGLADRMVRDLPALLRPGDVLVANDTRVIPAQLTARRGDARIGITLDQPRADGAWHALARNARRLHAGDELRFDGGGGAARHGGGTRRGRRCRAGIQPARCCIRRGAAPRRRARAAALHRAARRPAARRPRPTTRRSSPRRDGAVAAPTAGLHFTPALLAALERAASRRATVTLHVGAGTFLPVRADDIARHRMHAERGEIAAAAAAAINAARAARRARGRGRHHQPAPAGDRGSRRTARVRPFAGDTALFITAGLPVPRGRPAADQLPPAALDAVHAGLRLRRHRARCARPMPTRSTRAIASIRYGDACLLERAP